MSDNLIYDTKLCNYYGSLQLEVREGKYFALLPDWDHDSTIEVSKEFGEAFIKECKTNNNFANICNGKNPLE
jgi:hypothetical protein